MSLKIVPQFPGGKEDPEEQFLHVRIPYPSILKNGADKVVVQKIQITDAKKRMVLTKF